jgi:hypothetical protein
MAVVLCRGINDRRCHLIDAESLSVGSGADAGYAVTPFWP